MLKLNCYLLPHTGESAVHDTSGPTTKDKESQISLSCPNNTRYKVNSQPTLWLHEVCLEVLTVHGNELRLIWAKAFPLLCRASDIAAVEIIFDDFSYDAVLFRDSNLPPPSWRRADALRVKPWSQV